MKTKINALFNAIAGAMLAMLGFSAASCETIFGATEYGTPSADYKVLGTVTDEDGKPVNGIRVALGMKYSSETEDDSAVKDTVYTDASGKYEWTDSGWPVRFVSVTAVFDDIDGEQNGGEFESTSVTSGLNQTKKGSGEWYAGTYGAEINATLKKK